MNRLTEYYERNKKELYFALICVFAWGLAAHCYAFFDNNFTWDSLNELHAGIFGNNLRMFSGRYLVPTYRDLVRSDVTLPWLIGLLTLTWMGLAVFLVLQIFRVESKVTAFLIAGVFVTNTTISGTVATYIHDLDCFALSLLFAVAAVCVWQTMPRGWLLGVPLIAVSLGMYQSFVFTAVTLVMMASVMALVNGDRFQAVFLKGLKAVAMVLLGGGIYYVGLKVIVPMSGIALSSDYYNSMDLALKIQPGEIPALVASAYQDWFARLWEQSSVYPSILVRLALLCILGVSAGSLAVWFLGKRGAWKEKLLCLVLLALMPLVMNFLQVLTRGMNHDLMVFAIWLVYLLALLLTDWLAKQWKEGKLLAFLGQWQRRGCLLLVALLMYGNVQLANGMYLKKDLEYDAYLSLMTRVVGRMEQRPDYVTGETPVVFVGTPDILNEVIPGFKDYWNVTGMGFADVIHAPERERFQAYFDYVLNVPVNLVEEGQWLSLPRSETARQMPSYPAEGCMRLEGDVLFVKLGQTDE